MAELSPIVASRAPTSPTATTAPTSPSTQSSSTISSSSTSLSPSTSSSPAFAAVKLEICVDSIASAIAAEAGGARRLELCSGLTDGGLTPSYGLIQAVLSHVSIPVNVLIRPRPGDFLYSEEEISVMRADIMACKLSGVSGVVIGCLDETGNIHSSHLSLLCQASKGLSLTFHRAIDMSPEENLESNIELLISHNVDRILTSGLSPNVDEGKEILKKMVSISSGRLSIMAGGGITESNIYELLNYTGCQEIHGSARTMKDGKMIYRKSGVYMGGEKSNTGLEVEYSMKIADENRVRAMLQECEKSERERKNSQSQNSSLITNCQSSTNPSNVTSPTSSAFVSEKRSL